MKGYVNGEGYMGYVNGSYMLFASEEDYWEYMEDGSEILYNHCFRDRERQDFLWQ